MRNFVTNLTGVQAYKYAKEVHISTPGAVALGILYQTGAGVVDTATFAISHFELARAAAFYAYAKVLRKLYETRKTFAFPILEEFGFSGEDLDYAKQLFTAYVALSVEEMKG